METNPQAKYQIELMLANPQLVQQNMKYLDKLFGLNKPAKRFGPILPTEQELIRYQQQFNGMSTQEQFTFFQKELKAMHELGLFDDQMNIKALKQSKGIVELAVEMVMEWTGQNY